MVLKNLTERLPRLSQPTRRNHTGYRTSLLREQRNTRRRKSKWT